MLWVQHIGILVTHIVQRVNVYRKYMCFWLKLLFPFYRLDFKRETNYYKRSQFYIVPGNLIYLLLNTVIVLKGMSKLLILW